jgi:hypothetical protein
VELHVWKSRKVFPLQSNSQKKKKYAVFSLVDAREAVCSCVLIKLDQKEVFPVRFVWAFSQKGLRSEKNRRDALRKKTKRPKILERPLCLNAHTKRTGIFFWPGLNQDAGADCEGSFPFR